MTDYNSMDNQNNNSLDAKQLAIINISAGTATGDLIKLRPALVNGLDGGLTINEIKEVLVQLYAYCGFPRSLNGLTTLNGGAGREKSKWNK